MTAEEKKVLLIAASCLFQGVLQNKNLVQFSRIMTATVCKAHQFFSVTRAVQT